MSFGCMLCCFEVRVHAIATFIAKNFGFMLNPMGRVGFLLCCGFLLFSLHSFTGWLCGAYICALGTSRPRLKLPTFITSTRFI
jgi:hypothetical protein